MTRKQRILRDRNDYLFQIAGKKFTAEQRIKAIISQMNELVFHSNNLLPITGDEIFNRPPRKIYLNKTLIRRIRDNHGYREALAEKLREGLMQLYLSLDSTFATKGLIREVKSLRKKVK